jgi:hypothetical protein
MRTSSRTAAGVLAAGLATSLTAALALTATPATASTPDASTVTAPKGTGSSISAWSGTIDSPSAVVLVGQDDHALTVAIPGKATKYFKKRDAAVTVELSFTGTTPADDVDLYVLDQDGNEVASSATSDPGTEVVTVPVTAAAQYVVRVEGFVNAPGVTYNARATLVVTPKVR